MSSLSLATALTRRLGIEVPVLQAGMALVARPPLVAAVSEAGGLGVLGAAASPPEALAREIAEVRSLTDRPFGVDLAFPPELIDTSPDVLAAVRLAAAEQGHGAPPPELVGLFEPGRTDALVEVCCEERVAAVVSALGSPARYVDRLHAAGVCVLALCGTPQQATRLRDDGVDAVIASGAEAGGHTGSVGSLTLWRACVEAVDVPVVAAGGVAGGASLAAALVLGCQAAWVGTRFLASPEASLHERAREAVLTMAVTDTAVTRAFSGKPMRVLHNRYVSDFESAGVQRGFPLQLLEGESASERGLRDGDVDGAALPVGQCGGLVNGPLSAGEVVQELVRDAASALRRWVPA
ncbi:MAG TPA: nitronate monooxygenase [Acidimicrobiales bacterium]